jgi:hypothetical protein
MLPRPDCCDATQLRPLKVLDEAPDGEIILARCKCGVYWRHMLQTRMAMDGDEDRTLESFSRLTEEEGRGMLFGPLS